MLTVYAKLFSRITESSLMEQEIPVRYVFVMLLAIADPKGYVIGTDVAIARRLNMPLAEFLAALQRLREPDEDSNSKEHEGRRVIESDTERGYLIVNYLTYRDAKDADGRREYMRDYMRQKRSPKLPVSTRKLALTQEEAESTATATATADAKASIPTGSGAKRVKDNKPTTEEAITIAHIVGRKETTPWSQAEIKKFTDLKRSGSLTSENLSALSVYYAVERRKGDDGRHRRDLSTFLNNFPGELDRAHAMGQAKQPQVSADHPDWPIFLREGGHNPVAFKFAPCCLRDDFLKWQKGKA